MRWPSTRRGRRVCATLLTLLLAGVMGSPSPTRAQPLEWERVGTIQNVSGIAFDSDTLYACAQTGSVFTVKLRPGDSDFVQAFGPTTTCTDLGFSLGNIIYGLTAAGSGLYRTADRGITWTEAVRQAFTLPSHTPSGALVGGVRGNTDGTGSLAARSADDGLTWTLTGIAGSQGLGATSLLVLSPAPDRPLGRLVAGGYGGLATSDDDGMTWNATALYGPFLHNAWSTATVAAGEHAGRHLAVVESAGVPTGLYASTDGLTWTFLSAIPTQVPFETRLTAAPDGALYAYETGGDGPPAGAYGRPVWRSTDGGATWADVGRVWTAWSATPSQIEVGPDGRLYASARGVFVDTSLPLGGVFRTVARVVTAYEAPASPPLRLSVAPNPSADRAVVSVAGAAGRAVTVEVVDVAGRVVWQGRAPGGRAEIETSGWAAGVYTVRESSGVGAAAVRWTVLR